MEIGVQLLLRLLIVSLIAARYRHLQVHPLHPLHLVVLQHGQESI
jgi:hypothetical protein